MNPIFGCISRPVNSAPCATLHRSKTLSHKWEPFHGILNFLSHFILIIFLLITYLSKVVPNLRLFKPVRDPWISLGGITLPFSLLHAQWTAMLQCSEPSAPGRVAKLVPWQISRRRHMPGGCRDVPATRILTNCWPKNS